MPCPGRSFAAREAALRRARLWMPGCKIGLSSVLKQGSEVCSTVSGVPRRVEPLVGCRTGVNTFRGKRGTWNFARDTSGLLARRVPHRCHDCSLPAASTNRVHSRMSRRTLQEVLSLTPRQGACVVAVAPLAAATSSRRLRSKQNASKPTWGEGCRQTNSDNPLT